MPKADWLQCLGYCVDSYRLTATGHRDTRSTHTFFLIFRASFITIFICIQISYNNDYNNLNKAWLFDQGWWQCLAQALQMLWINKYFESIVLTNNHSFFVWFVLQFNHPPGNHMYYLRKYLLKISSVLLHFLSNQLSDLSQGKSFITCRLWVQWLRNIVRCLVSNCDTLVI